MDLSTTQSLIHDANVDAWILSDYENQNSTMVSLLGNKMLTRKILMIIPGTGKPYLIAHLIDSVYLNDADTKARFDLVIYRTWQELLDRQKECFRPYHRVYMDVSEHGLLPRASRADYGTVNYILSLGIEVLSSADILQHDVAVLSDKSLQSQIEVCKTLLNIKNEAFRLIALHIQQRGYSDELDIQSYIARRFDEEKLFYDEPPLVAIGKNASDPHYTPTPEAHSRIMEGDLVLIDMWAKGKEKGDVYGDITWMGYVGTEVPDIYARRFAIVKGARDAAIDFLKTTLPLRPVQAYEADDVARKVISDAGYGEYFTHRLGHSIADGISPHGPGANLDNFESHDSRVLLDHTSCSDEPGIYAPDFGMRSETDLQIVGTDLVVSGGLQEEIIPILALLNR